MRHASREATAQSKANDGSSRLRDQTLSGELPTKGLYGPDDLANALHRRTIFSTHVPLLFRMPWVPRKVQSTLVLHELRGRYALVTVLLPPFEAQMTISSASGTFRVMVREIS